MKISSTALCGIVSLLLVVVCVNAFPLLDQSQHNTAVDENDASNSLESILSESPHIRSARQVIDRGCVEACARYIYLLRRSRLRGPYFPSFYRQRYALHYLACRNRCIIRPPPPPPPPPPPQTTTPPSQTTTPPPQTTPPPPQTTPPPPQTTPEFTTEPPVQVETGGGGN